LASLSNTGSPHGHIVSHVALRVNPRAPRSSRMPARRRDGRRGSARKPSREEAPSTVFFFTDGVEPRAFSGRFQESDQLTNRTRTGAAALDPCPSPPSPSLP
jgi:hypothetical protein